MARVNALRMLALVAALLALVAGLVIAPPNTPAARADGGSSGGGQGNSGGGNETGCNGSSCSTIQCLSDGGVAVNGWNPAYHGRDPRCVYRPDIWNIKSLWVQCLVYYDVWRFYGTTQDPALYTTLTRIPTRTLPPSPSSKEACAGLKGASEEVARGSQVFVTMPSPWDARGFDATPGSSVWNISAPGQTNEQGETIQGSHVLEPSPQEGGGTDGPTGRPTDCVFSCDAGSGLGAKERCYSDGGGVKVVGKTCLLMPNGRPLYRSEPTSTTINGVNVEINDCKSLMSGPLTAAGAPYRGKYNTVMQWLLGTSVPSTAAPIGADPDVVQQAASDYIKKIVSASFALVRFGDAGRNRNWTLEFARALVGGSGSFADDVTPRAPSDVTPEFLKGSPCGSALDFALFSTLRKANGEAVIDGDTGLTPRQVAAARSENAKAQVQMGFCVAPVVQNAWVVWKENNDLAKATLSNASGAADESVVYTDPRYPGTPMRLRDIEARSEGNLIPKYYPLTADGPGYRDIGRFKNAYKDAIKTSLKAVYYDPRNNNKLRVDVDSGVPLGAWLPKNPPQGLGYLNSPESTAKLEQRIDSALDTVGFGSNGFSGVGGSSGNIACRVGAFSQGLLSYEEPPPIVTVDPVEETETVDSAVRASVVVPRGLFASGLSSEYRFRVPAVRLYCGARLCNHAAYELDPTLLSQRGRLAVEVSPSSAASKYVQCATRTSVNCDFYAEVVSNTGSGLQGYEVKVVFYSPTPRLPGGTPVKIRARLVDASAQVQTYKRVTYTDTVCSTPAGPPVVGTPSAGPAPRAGSADPAPAPQETCTTTTYTVVEPDVVLTMPIAPTWGAFGPSRVVAGSVGAR